MNRREFVALGLLLVSAGCSRRNRDAAGAAVAEVALAEMTVDDVAGKLARREPLAVFDANGRARYLQGHVPGARWVAFNHLAASDLPADRSTPLVFYCANEH